MRKALFLLLAVLAGSALAVTQPKVVDSSKLRQLLPTNVPQGFKRKPPTDSVYTNPLGRFSSAEVTYETPGEVPRMVTVSIQDMAENVYARALSLDLARDVGRRETPEGYTKSVVVKGKYRGKETGSQMTSGNEVKFMVADRFLVTVTATRVPDIGVLYSLIDAMDLAALEKLR